MEERLLQLEGDKDSLHLQVRIQNSDISIDIPSRCGLIIGRIVFRGLRMRHVARVTLKLTRQKKDRNLKGKRKGSVELTLSSSAFQSDARFSSRPPSPSGP